MPKNIDISTWARRDVFEFFRDFDKPYFNICTNVDITRLLELLRERPALSPTLAYHYFALRVANEIEPFRYRLRDGKVIVHDVINGGTTVLQPNESFTFAYFDYTDDFDQFMRDAQRSVDQIKESGGPFDPRAADDAIHFTSLPWVSFTSFSHARNWKTEDSIPKMAFGKYINETGRVLLPFSVEVHHALVDGVHVGRFINRLEEVLQRPDTYIS